MYDVATELAKYYFYHVVPDPTIKVTILSSLIVGQLLTLECNGTTVRGITSNVYIVWRHDNLVVQNTHVTAITTMDDLLVYQDSYTISPLSTSDDGVVYECSLVDRGGLGVRVNDSIRLLNVIGEYFYRTISNSAYT